MNPSRTVSVSQAEIDHQASIIQELRAENERTAVEEGTPRKACFLTFGCQQNEADSERYAGMLDAMRYICMCDPKKIFSFRIGEETAEALSYVTEGYLTTQLERGFSTLDFYKSLKNPLEAFQLGDGHV